MKPFPPPGYKVRRRYDGRDQTRFVIESNDAFVVYSAGRVNRSYAPAITKLSLSLFNEWASRTDWSREWAEMRHPKQTPAKKTAERLRSEWRQEP